MKILSIACFLIATALVGYIATSVPFIATSASEAAIHGDPAAALQKVQNIDDAETLRQAAEFFAMSQALQTSELARYIAYFYSTLVLLALALVAVGILARRASNNSFKGMPLRGTP